MSILRIPTAKIFEPLLVPARYKAAHGGRGSGKSHFFGELLVETCQDLLQAKIGAIACIEAMKKAGKRLPLQVQVTLQDQSGAMLLGWLASRLGHHRCIGW